MSIFNDKALKSVAEAAAKIMAETSHGTHPKGEKEKSLAALAHPKDKITHKDVLVGRGVLKKEEMEQVDEGNPAKWTMAARGKLINKMQQGMSSTPQQPRAKSDDEKASLARMASDKAALARKTTKEEIEQVQEGWDEMMKDVKKRQGPQPSGGAGKKEGTRYGGSKQKDEKSPVKESFTEMLQKYDNLGLKAFVTEEPDNEQFTKELEDQKASMAGKKKPASVAAASTQGVKQMPEEVEVFDADEINGTTVETIDERKLTPSESEKKEDYVKSMKKNLSGFKQRYGERGKSVMYATATKMAKRD